MSHKFKYFFLKLTFSSQKAVGTHFE